MSPYGYGIRYDHFMVAADFDAYRDAQSAVATLWQERAQWWRKAIDNTARMSWFSADRAIREHAGEIWRAESIRT